MRPAFTVPALFVCGNNDAIVPCKGMRRDYEKYGGEKRFVVLDDSHHLPFLDEPETLAQEVSSFLTGQD